MKEDIKRKQVRPQPTVVEYKENPNPPAEHVEIMPGETLEEAKAREKAIDEVMRNNKLDELREEDNSYRVAKPAGKPQPLWAKIVAAPFIIGLFILALAIIIGAIAIIVWFIGWLVFGAW